MIDIPKEIKGKKLVMSPEMFAAELSQIIIHIIGLPHLGKYNTTQKQIFAEEYAKKYLLQIYSNNIKSKPDDPEQIN